MSLPPAVPSYEMLLGACAANGLDRAGDAEALKRRLGDHLVAQLFSTGKGKKRANPTSGADTAPKRPPSAWVTFLRGEKERVKGAGFHGRVDILKECARRWAIHKRVGTSSAPLMLMAGSSSDASDAASEASAEGPDALLVELIAELPEEEMKATLAARGLPISDDHQANAFALARATMA